MTDASRALARLGLLAALFAVGPAHGTLFQVSIDTTALSGQSATLAFDLIDGNGAADSSVTISGFSPIDALGGYSATLGVSGSLPGDVTLSDTEAFNEYLQSITLGNTLAFAFSATGSFGGGTPDAFSFFILDADGFDSLVTTGGLANALLTYDIGVTDPPQPQVYPGETIPVNGGDPEPVSITATAVPEPGALALAVAGLLALGVARPVRKVPSRTLPSAC